MRSGTIAFALGVWALTGARALPDPMLVELLPLALGVALVAPRVRLVALFATGFLWALLRAHLMVAERLPEALVGQNLVVEGVIASLPRVDPKRVRFLLRVEAIHAPDGGHWRRPGLVRLSWYEPAPVVRAGERWRLAVKLKQPHGFMNPGGFDYEGWLFRRGVRATGYVQGRGEHGRLAAAEGVPITRARERLARAIERALEGRREAGLVSALAVGHRAAITPSQWQVLAATGTSHLMAISGLHIGLVAGLAFALARAGWACSAQLSLRVAAPRAAAVAALAAATGYAALAGFSVPTQRALVMAVVMLGNLLIGQRTAASVSLAAALCAVLALDPLAPLSAGFWLSFVAVAAILFGMTGRTPPHTRLAGLWWRYGRTQWLVAVGLVPVTLATFHQHPLIGPLANLVAVPWTGLVVVPLTLGGTALLTFSPAAGGAVIEMAAAALAWLWPTLELLAALDVPLRANRLPPVWAIAAAAAGVVLALAPRGFPCRWLGVALVAPLVGLPAPKPAAGELRFTLLDVGQGLAAVVETGGKVLVYDTGPVLAPGFDAGRAVLAPFLRARGIDRVDLLVLSHGDSDHSGGLASLLESAAVERILTSALDKAPDAVPCHAGQRWRWHEVEFVMLGPGAGQVASPNDRSCVLSIRHPGGRILLPGDIERDAERRLLALPPGELGADILVAPHHGSRTSSTPAFVRAVRPRFVLFSAGYRNRFGFPALEVRARYEAAGAMLLDTVSHGAIAFTLTSTDKGGRPSLSGPRLHRCEHARFWHHRGRAVDAGRCMSRAARPL